VPVAYRCACGSASTLTRRQLLALAAIAPVAANIGVALGSSTVPRASAEPAWSTAGVSGIGRVPRIIGRAEWGADESTRRGAPLYDSGVRAGIVHHTATPNEYDASESAGIVRGIYRYHTSSLGWGDIAYNALVDRFGQVFEGRFGGITRPVEGAHTGGFNANTWAVAMIGNFDLIAPATVQLRAVGQLLGWRLAMDSVNPHGSVTLTSAGGPYTRFARGATPTLATIFGHRDVGDTACPGSLGYAALDRIRDYAAGYDKPANAQDLADALRGGAIYDRWQAMGGMKSAIGAPTSPEASGAGSTRYVLFDKGAVYWSPESGAQPMMGAIYDAWATLGYERGALGLPTSGELQEPEWIGQNFQHGTLNYDRSTFEITRVIDGIAVRLPPPLPDGPPAELERFTPARNRV
jgi:uncharacterized protein with LGFP repeats